MIQVILDLPTCLSAAIFCNWLNFKSICRMDSACCEKSKRMPFLNLLQSEECIVPFHATSNEQLVWINRRSIKSNGFSMRDVFSEDEYQKFFERSGHCVRSFFQGSHPTKEGFLRLITQYCHNLSTFYSASRRQKGNYMELLSVNPHLEELVLSCCHPFALSELTMPNLKAIGLDGSAFDDATLSMFIKAAPRLTFLSLTRTRVTADGFIKAMGRCLHVRFLELQNLPDIDSTLLHISSNLARIEHIDMTACKSLSNTGIAAVAQYTQALQSIHFTYNHTITNACLVSLAQYQSDTLEIVMMKESVYNRGNDHVEDLQLFNIEAVTVFREKCPKLKVFDWEKALHIFGEIYKADLLALVVRADRATTLELSFVDDSVLRTIASHCTQLRKLKLYIIDSPSIDACSDAAILAVAQQCHHLNTVVMLKPQQHRARLLELLKPYPRVTVPESVYLLPSYSLDSLYRKSRQ